MEKPTDQPRHAGFKPKLVRGLLRARKFIRNKILHASDTPHRIAVGVSVAMFAMVLPIPGQTLIALTLAAFLGGNKAVCIPVVWISNPFTMFPIWYTALGIAGLVLPSGTTAASAERLDRLASMKLDLLSRSFWDQVLAEALSLGAEIWIGCVLLGLILGVLAYFPARWAVLKHRERRRLRNQRRHRFRAAARQARLGRSPEAA